MEFNRYEAKMRARASMRGAKPHVMLVALVFLLLTTGVDQLVSLILNNSQLGFYANFFSYVNAGYDPMEVLEYLLIALPTTGLLATVISLLITVYTTVMVMGYTSYSLRLARHEGPSYRNLFDGFHLFGRVILMNILQYIFIFLWTFLAIIPGIIVFVVGFVVDSVIVVTIAVLLYLAGILFSICVTYRYRLAVYFLIDNLDMGALRSITESKHAMNGRKGSLFLLDLSFLGWCILSLFTFGILSLWLVPYIYTTEANFYDIAVHGRYSAPDVPPVL